MADEIKQETTTADEPEMEEEETVDAPDSEEEPDKDPESDPEAPEDKDVDWEKVARDEQDARKKAEEALARKRFKQSKRQREEAEPEYDEDEDGDEEGKPLTSKDVERILAQDRAERRKESQANEAVTIAKDLAGSDEEASAIVAIFNRRTWPEDMPLQDQLKEAYYIAHGPRLLAKHDELRRSLRSKTTKKKAGSENTHPDAPRANEPKMSPTDKAEFHRLGFAWDGKRYVKTLANGRKMVRDVKNKRTFIEG